ncbi:MAG: TonB family protein [Flavobacteriales bacterium]|nr:TonB family protein [Flavobacteriales bacterium]MCB9334859.1 TonB family protein [Flavobacteriales bacterium]
MMNNELLTYLLKSTLAFSLFYLAYKTLFAKNTFIQLNRFYLLAIVPLSIVLPFISFSSLSSSQEFQVLLPQFEVSTNNIELGFSLNVSFILLSTSSLFFVAFIIKIAKMLVIVNKIKQGKISNYNPFSFFGFVHIPNNLDEDEKAIILAHEIVHVKQCHSIDILIYEFMKILFWFNPLVWLAENDVKTNHEYIADSIASKNNVQSYSKVLVAQLLGVNCSDLANNFNYEPLIKKRIKMMKKQKQQKLKAAMYALIIPVACVSIIATSTINVSAKTPVHQEDAKTEKVYDKVDQMPDFKGGIEKLYEFMGSSLKYPEEAKDIEGVVFVSFVVNSKGKVEKVNLEKGINTYLDNEAMRVVKSMPNWTPGKHDGKDVSVKMVLPISYKKS